MHVLDGIHRDGGVGLVEAVVGHEALCEVGARGEGPRHAREDLLMREGAVVHAHLVDHPIEELLGDEEVVEVHADVEGTRGVVRARGGREGGDGHRVEVQGAGISGVDGHEDVIPLLGGDDEVLAGLVLHGHVVDAVVVVVEDAGVAQALPLQDGAVLALAIAAEGHDGLHALLVVGVYPRTEGEGVAVEKLVDLIGLDEVLGRPAVGASHGHLEPLVLAGAAVAKHAIGGGDGARILAVAEALDHVDGPVRGLANVRVAGGVDLEFVPIAFGELLGAVALGDHLVIAAVERAAVRGEEDMVQAHAVGAGKGAVLVLVGRAARNLFLKEAVAAEVERALVHSHGGEARRPGVDGLHVHGAGHVHHGGGARERGGRERSVHRKGRSRDADGAISVALGGGGEGALGPLRLCDVEAIDRDLVHAIEAGLGGLLRSEAEGESGLPRRLDVLVFGDRSGAHDHAALHDHAHLEVAGLVRVVDHVNHVGEGEEAVELAREAGLGVELVVHRGLRGLIGVERREPVDLVVGLGEDAHLVDVALEKAVLVDGATSRGGCSRGGTFQEKVAAAEGDVAIIDWWRR
mmetsp:Transcript_57992/g.184209  ORF Transcript_57992/g.184209 Transcript_57992/m.184209 type:complete len:577 (-) Transcript_57992:47-1777(-)